MNILKLKRNQKIYNINKHHGGLKVKCIEIPNASYTERYPFLTEALFCKFLNILSGSLNNMLIIMEAMI